MRLKLIATLIICCTVLFGVSAQMEGKLISFNYENEELSGVLADLNERYQLRFTYFSNRLPMDFSLTADANNEPLPSALDILFAEAPLRYAVIGDQIALRSDPGKQLTQLELPRRVRQTSPIYPEEPRPTPPSIRPIDVRQPVEIETGPEFWEDENLDPEARAKIEAAMRDHERSLEREAYDDSHRLAQISLLPYLGTNTHRSDEITNKVSINVLWGTSRGVDGFELGGVANSVTDDVSGFQMAGGANWVGGNLTGSQFAGVFNRVGRQVKGVQIAGAANIAQDSVCGVQVAGLFNYTENHLDGEQWAGLFNYSDGDVGKQVSALYNQAEDVSRRQIGLINVCDTTVRAPIGLLNIVRRGYNRLELGSSESLFATLSGKLGSYRLYNIFFLGTRWDEVERLQDGELTAGTFMSWSLGYGFGVAPRLGKRLLLNTELIGMHVNELQPWTNELNFLTQVRLTLDWQVARGLSFYSGPVLNLMWSEIYDADTGTYGSRVAPSRVMWESQNGATNFKGWVGFTAGLRF